MFPTKLLKKEKQVIFLCLAHLYLHITPKHGQQKAKPQTAKKQARVDGCLRGKRQPQGILTTKTGCRYQYSVRFGVCVDKQ